ncbi:MAG: CBS domain-containing protein [Isosphaeraceae bacterium]
MLVSDVLKAKGRRVVSIGPEATVKEALALFVRHNIGSLPVVEVTGQLIGIFTERDVIFGDHLDLDRFHNKLIDEVKTPNPVTCGPNDTLADAMSKMAKRHVGQLPVVEENVLVGLLSVGDLIEALYEQIEAENQHLMNYLHGRS